MEPSDKLQHKPWEQYPALQDLFKTVTANNITARFVGGCVRHAVLNKPGTDFDIAANSPIAKVMEILEPHYRVIPTGLKHGTITVVLDKSYTVEITHLRVDIATDGRHATTEFTSNWQADAERRDFTINALYADWDGTLYDPCNGLTDLHSRYIRFIGDAATRLREDFLRAYRYFRFTALYQPENHDAAALSAITDQADQLRGLAGQRIQAELRKLWAAPYALPAIKHMGETRVLASLDLPTPPMELLRPTLTFAALLAILCRFDKATANTLDDRLNLTKHERRHLFFLCEQAYVDLNDNHTRWGWIDQCNRSEFTDLLTMNQVEGEDYRQRLAEYDEIKKIPFPLTGQDLLNEGINSGPHIGIALQAARESWVNAMFSLEKSELMKIALKKCD